MELNAWSKDLGVEVAGHGAVSHAGSAVLRLLADGAGCSRIWRRCAIRERCRGQRRRVVSTAVADGTLPADFVDAFVTALGEHRAWQRETAAIPA